MSFASWLSLRPSASLRADPFPLSLYMYSDETHSTGDKDEAGGKSKPQRSQSSAGKDKDKEASASAAAAKPDEAAAKKPGDGPAAGTKLIGLEDRAVGAVSSARPTCHFACFACGSFAHCGCCARVAVQVGFYVYRRYFEAALSNYGGLLMVRQTTAGV